MRLQFADMTSLWILWRFGILVSIVVTGSSFMSISLLVLVLGQFLLIRDWPKIQKRKYTYLSFAQHLQTGTRKSYQIWRKCL